MTDEDTPLDAPHDGEALLYDYFKYLTSLCLFSLGGVAAIAQGSKGVTPAMLIGVLVVIGGAAMVSFSGAAEIVQARFKRKSPGKYLDFYRNASPILLSIGLGMFLYLFARTLK